MRSNAPRHHNVYRCHPSLLSARSGALGVRISRADKPAPAAFGWLAEWRFARPFGGVPAGRKLTRAERIEN